MTTALTILGIITSLSVGVVCIMLFIASIIEAFKQTNTEQQRFDGAFFMFISGLLILPFVLTFIYCIRSL